MANLELVQAASSNFLMSGPRVVCSTQSSQGLNHGVRQGHQAGTRATSALGPWVIAVYKSLQAVQWCEISSNSDRAFMPTAWAFVPGSPHSGGLLPQHPSALRLRLFLWLL